MIPKKIHYCWFGGNPLNKLGVQCLESWKEHLPDYEIIQWDESNFDVNCCQYVREAYEAKKWAFVSDYARCKIVYEQGGVYFDTDVETIASFDDIIERGAFMGCENPMNNPDIRVALGLGFAVEAGHPFYKELLESYESSTFYNADGSLNLYTVVDRVTDLLRTHGLKDGNEIQTVEGITVYPSEYFCPINMDTGKMEKTKNTRSIHRYAATWVDPKSRFRGKVYFWLVRLLGEKTAKKIRKYIGRK